MSPTPLHGGPDDELIAVTLRGEFRPDERVDLVYLGAPGALAERQAALPLVGVNDSYTERLDVPAVVERVAQRIGTISATSAGGAEVRPPPASPGLPLLPRRPAHPERRLSVAEAKWQQRGAVLRAAYEAYPERFPHGVSVPPPLPTAAWINKPLTVPALAAPERFRAQAQRDRLQNQAALRLGRS